MKASHLQHLPPPIHHFAQLTLSKVQTFGSASPRITCTSSIDVVAFYHSRYSAHKHTNARAHTHTPLTPPLAQLDSVSCALNSPAIAHPFLILQSFFLQIFWISTTLYTSLVNERVETEKGATAHRPRRLHFLPKLFRLNETLESASAFRNVLTSHEEQPKMQSWRFSAGHLPPRYRLFCYCRRFL